MFHPLPHTDDTYYFAKIILAVAFLLSSYQSMINQRLICNCNTRIRAHIHAKCAIFELNLEEKREDNEGIPYLGYFNQPDCNICRRSCIRDPCVGKTSGQNSLRYGIHMRYPYQEEYTTLFIFLYIYPILLPTRKPY